MSASPDSTDSPHSRKVFVGNLSYKTNYKSLKNEFSAVGTVTKVNVISRNGKRLGFGFIQFTNKEDTIKAVETLNGKTLDGREIKVAYCTPPKNKPTKPTTNNTDKKDNKDSDNSNKPNNKTPKKARKKQARKPRRPFIPLEEREESTDVVYVRNLPTSTTSETLENLFKDYGFVSVTTKKALGKGANFLFAFVTVDSAENQAKAVAELNGKEIDGSEIIVLKAFKMIPISEENVENEPESPSPVAPKKAAPKKKKVVRKPAAKKEAAEGAQDASSPQEGKPKRKKQYKPRKPKDNNGSAAGSSENSPAQATSSTE